MKFIYILYSALDSHFFTDDAPIKGIATDVERSQKKYQNSQRDNQIGNLNLR